MASAPCLPFLRQISLPTLSPNITNHKQGTGAGAHHRNLSHMDLSLLHGHPQHTKFYNQVYLAPGCPQEGSGAPAPVSQAFRTSAGSRFLATSLCSQSYRGVKAHTHPEHSPAPKTSSLRTARAADQLGKPDPETTYGQPPMESKA